MMTEIIFKNTIKPPKIKGVNRISPKFIKHIKWLEAQIIKYQRSSIQSHFPIF